MKRTLSLILAALMCLSVLVCVPAAAEAETITIGTPEELKAFAQSAVTDDYTGITVVLTADIVTDTTFTPVGSVGRLNENSTLQYFHTPFNGTFDGQGHTVTLDMGNQMIPPVCDIAFFGCIGTDGTVKNLRVDGSVKAIGNAAGICDDNYGLIVNCVSDVTFTANLPRSPLTYVGGICDMNHGDIVNCAFTGAFDASDENYPSSSSLGGIAANICNGSPIPHVYNCYSCGDVLTASKTQNGAIAGRNDSDSTAVADCAFNKDKFDTAIGFNSVGCTGYASSACSNGTLYTVMNEGTAAYEDTYGPLGAWQFAADGSISFAFGDDVCTHEGQTGSVCPVCGAKLGEGSDITSLLTSYEYFTDGDTDYEWTLWFVVEDGELVAYDNDDEDYAITDIAKSDDGYTLTVTSRIRFEVITDGSTVSEVVLYYKSNVFEFYPPAGEDEHVHALGTYHAAVAPGCETDGVGEYWECSGCDALLNADGEEITAPAVIPAAGHVYDGDTDADCNVCGAVRELPHARGDVNGDGQIGTADSNILARYIAGFTVTVDSHAADVNGDGEIGTADANMLTRLIAGFTVTVDGDAD